MTAVPLTRPSPGPGPGRRHGACNAWLTEASWPQFLALLRHRAGRIGPKVRPRRAEVVEVAEGARDVFSDARESRRLWVGWLERVIKTAGEALHDLRVAG